MAEVNYSSAFGTYVPQQLADNIKSGLDVNKLHYDISQQQNADKAFADNIDPEGNLSEVDFYKAAKQYGLTPEQTKRAQEYRKYQAQSSAEIINQKQALRDQGIDPEVMGRGQNAQATAEKPTAEKPTTNIFSSLYRQLRGDIAPKSSAISSGASGESSLPVIDPSNNPDQPLVVSGVDVDGQVQGQVQVPGSITNPPARSFEEDPNIQYGYGNTPAVEAPVQKSYRQKLEDSYNPAKDIYNTINKPTSTPEENRFDFTPENSGDKYQEFKSAADQLIVKSGTAASVPEYFNQVYNNAVGEVTPVPPNPALRFQGDEGRVKYRAEQLKYEAELDRQDAIGMKAVNAEKKRIAEYAQTQGANKAAQTSQDLALQQRAFEVAGRDAVTALGFDASKVNPEQARELDSRRSLMTQTKELLISSREDLQGKNGPAAQYAAIVPMMNNLGIIEKAGTIGGQEKLEQLFANIDKSVYQAFKQDGIAGARQALLGKLVTNPQAGYAAVVKLLADAEKHGVLASDLQAAMPKVKLTPKAIGKKMGVKASNDKPLIGISF